MGSLPPLLSIPFEVRDDIFSYIYIEIHVFLWAINKKNDCRKPMKCLRLNTEKLPDASRGRSLTTATLLNDHAFTKLNILNVCRMLRAEVLRYLAASRPLHIYQAPSFDTLGPLRQYLPSGFAPNLRSVRFDMNIMDLEPRVLRKLCLSDFEELILAPARACTPLLPLQRSIGTWRDDIGWTMNDLEQPRTLEELALVSKRYTRTVNNKLHDINMGDVRVELRLPCGSLRAEITVENVTVLIQGSAVELRVSRFGNDREWKDEGLRACKALTEWCDHVNEGGQGNWLSPQRARNLFIR